MGWESESKEERLSAAAGAWRVLGNPKLKASAAVWRDWEPEKWWSGEEEGG
jgi:hypothetical protein